MILFLFYLYRNLLVTSLHYFYLLQTWKMYEMIHKLSKKIAPLPYGNETSTID